MYVICPSSVFEVVRNLSFRNMVVPEPISIEFFTFKSSRFVFCEIAFASNSLFLVTLLLLSLGLEWLL